MKLFSRTKVPFGQLMQWVSVEDWGSTRTRDSWEGVAKSTGVETLDRVISDRNELA